MKLDIKRENEIVFSEISLSYIGVCEISKRFKSL